MYTDDRVRIAGLALAICLLLPAMAWGQTQTATRPAYTTTDDLTDVRPFLAWFQDAVVTEGIDVEPYLTWSSGEIANTLLVQARVAVWARERVELGGAFGLASIDFDAEALDGQTSATDMTLYGRYQFAGRPGSGEPTFAGGMTLDIPFGDEDIGEGNFDFSVFGAFRTQVENGVDIFASVAIESLELSFNDDRENGVRLGGGAIFPLTEESALIAEANLGTTDDSFVLTGGIDLELPPGGHLRGALSVGLDDGSDDIGFTLAFAIPVY